jgi:hypothetical protein
MSAINLSPARLLYITRQMPEFETTKCWEEFADSPSLLAYLDAHFKGAEDLQRALLEEVDESDFSLRDWMEALLVLNQWLEERSLNLPINDNIGYVSCAGASAGTGAHLSHLPSLVADLLEQYGCERAVEK